MTVKHAEILQKNLPYGRIWQSDNDELFGRILVVLGACLDNVYNKINQLKLEFSPKTTNDLLDEWEADAGIPDNCFSKGDNNSARVEILRRKILERVPATKTVINNYLININVTLNEDPNNPIVTIGLQSTADIYARCGVARCGNDRLLDFATNDTVKCWIKRVLPAHLYIKFVATP